MGAGAAAPTGVGSSPAPIVAPPVSTPIATPTATPSSTPQGGKGGNPTSNGPTQAQLNPFDGVRPTSNDSGFGDPRGYANNGMAPTAPQQPYVNPYMQTYGQNNTPQQQMFNRFPQRFQQPQPVAQGPVYADQSLNAPGNQPQQYSGQPQYGRFGRGFMPQNRGGYDRQIDQLRGGYNRPMPPMMPQRDMGYGNGMPYSSPASVRPGYQYDPAPSAAPADAEAAWNLTTQQAQFAPGTDMVKAKQDFMQRYNPRPQQPGGMQQAAFMNSLLKGQPLSGQQAAFMSSLLKGQPLSGQPATGQTPIPAYAQPYATSLANQPNAPAGGKGGNPTAQYDPASGVSPVAPPIGSGFY